jgi:hypothetical protein
VRRNADAHERRLERADRLHLGAKPCQRFAALRRIRTEDLLIRDSTDAHRAHRLERRAGIVRVGKRRDAGKQPLGDPGTGGIEERFGRQHIAARFRETQDPLAERQVLEESAHHRELEVGVRVHEPRHERHRPELDVRAGRRVGSRPDVRNAAFVLHDRSVLDRRTRDRNDPPRVVAFHGAITQAERTGRTGPRL